MVGRHIEQVLSCERHQERAEPCGPHAWDARVKLALLAAAIVLNIWVALPWLSAVLLVAGIVLLAWARPQWRTMLTYLLAPLWPVGIVLVGFSLGFGVTPVAKLGPLTLYLEGFSRGGLVALRAYCDIVWLMFCILTTPYAQIFTALRWYRVPAVVVDTLAMMYRYSFVLHTEFRRMRLAAQTRGGRAGYRTEMVSLGRIAAQIFIRAFDRSERIYLAMAARGGEQGE